MTEDITAASFDSPTTIARFEDRFCLPNARFSRDYPTGAEFNIVSIPAE